MLHRVLYLDLLYCSLLTVFEHWDIDIDHDSIK